jgi:hypothetical protein
MEMKTFTIDFLFANQFLSAIQLLFILKEDVVLNTVLPFGAGILSGKLKGCKVIYCRDYDMTQKY